MCFKLPENVSLEDGAMCEPLSVGVHACQRASVGPNTKVLILGAGPIGLVTLLTAKAFGSPKVVIADISDERLKVAQELGADSTITLSTNDAVQAPSILTPLNLRFITWKKRPMVGVLCQDEESEVVALQKAMGTDIDITIDCVGMTKSMRTGLAATRSGGRVCLVGCGHVEMKVPLCGAAQR